MSFVIQYYLSELWVNVLIFPLAEEAKNMDLQGQTEGPFSLKTFFLSSCDLRSCVQVLWSWWKNVYTAIPLLIDFQWSFCFGLEGHHKSRVRHFQTSQRLQQEERPLMTFFSFLRWKLRAFFLLACVTLDEEQKTPFPLGKYWPLLWKISRPTDFHHVLMKARAIPARQSCVVQGLWKNL